MNYLNHWNLTVMQTVRMLWMQHSEWTRMAFTAVIFQNPNEEAVTQRLLRNPIDFGNFLYRFFGWTFANSFTCLLTEHLTLAVALVKASKENKTKEAENISNRLFKNADEISALLAAASPYWFYEEWRAMLYRHLNLASQMAEEDIKGAYAKSIQTYDIFEAEVMQMADMMIKGLPGPILK
jgi:hypothetical protein